MTIININIIFVVLSVNQCPKYALKKKNSKKKHNTEILEKNFPLFNKKVPLTFCFLSFIDWNFHLKYYFYVIIYKRFSKFSIFRINAKIPLLPRPNILSLLTARIPLFTYNGIPCTINGTLNGFHASVALRKMTSSKNGFLRGIPIGTAFAFMKLNILYYQLFGILKYMNTIYHCLISMSSVRDTYWCLNGRSFIFVFLFLIIKCAPFSSYPIWYTSANYFRTMRKSLNKWTSSICILNYVHFTNA